ncbi:hypothetical protein D3C71_1663370 [compost metagenome]
MTAPWWTWFSPTWTYLQARSTPRRRAWHAPGNAPKTRAPQRAGRICCWRWTATPRPVPGSTPHVRWLPHLWICCWPMPMRTASKAWAMLRWRCTGKPWIAPRQMRSRLQHSGAWAVRCRNGGICMPPASPWRVRYTLRPATPATAPSRPPQTPKPCAWVKRARASTLHWHWRATTTPA